MFAEFTIKGISVEEMIEMLESSKEAGMTLEDVIKELKKLIAKEGEFSNE